MELKICIRTRYLSFLFYFSLTTLFSQAQTSTPQAALDRFISDPCWHSASIGLELEELQSGRTLLAHQPDLLLPPASTLKLLTTYRALQKFGPDHQIETHLGYRGLIRNDTLIGDLVIRGFGDPTLGSQHHSIDLPALLKRWCEVVMEHAINHISGDIIGDASFINGMHWMGSWPYEDLGNYYGAMPVGLNVHDNLHYLTLQQHPELGGTVEITGIEPVVPGLKISSMVTAAGAGSGDQAYIIGAPRQNDRFVRGTIPLGKGNFRIKGSLPDPAHFLAWHLREQLSARNIESRDAKSRYQFYGEIDVIDKVESLPMLEIIKLTNERSINLFAESLWVLTQKNEVVPSSKSLDPSSAELDLQSARILDGSGLSPDNAISTRQMVDVLAAAYRDSAFFELFRQTLPQAGVNGTVASVLRNSSARGSLFLKSGLIAGVRNYAGYIRSKSQQWYAFAVFTYNPDCSAYIVRQKLAQLMESLYLTLP